MSYKGARRTRENGFQFCYINSKIMFVPQIQSDLTVTTGALAHDEADGKYLKPL